MKIFEKKHRIYACLNFGFNTWEGGWSAYGTPLNKYNILFRRESTPGGGATFARYTLPRLRYAQPLARSQNLAYATVFVFPIVLEKNNNTIRPNRASELCERASG